MGIPRLEAVGQCDGVQGESAFTLVSKSRHKDKSSPRTSMRSFFPLVAVPTILHASPSSIAHSIPVNRGFDGGASPYRYTSPFGILNTTFRSEAWLDVVASSRISLEECLACRRHRSIGSLALRHKRVASKKTLETESSTPTSPMTRGPIEGQGKSLTRVHPLYNISQTFPEEASPANLIADPSQGTRSRCSSRSTTTVSASLLLTLAEVPQIPESFHSVLQYLDHASSYQSPIHLRHHFSMVVYRLRGSVPVRHVHWIWM